MSIQTLPRPSTREASPSLDELLAGEGSRWTSLDNQYDRGFRAGKSAALRDHLGMVMEAAKRHLAEHPQDSTAIAVFTAKLQQILVSEGDDGPFEFDGGLGI
jgi:hypothetical protein